MSFVYQRRYQGPIQAVLLDWAGTTMDYGCMAPAVVFSDVFEKEGVPITMAEARAPMGAAKMTHIQRVTELGPVRERWREAKGCVPTMDDVERMFESFVPLQLACLSQYSDLIPGTLEMVAECRHRGMKIGSTTGYTSEMMAINLKDAKGQGYEPDATFCASDVPQGRPSPYMCLRNVIALEVSPVEACVKIDDTCPGIEEGLNAGMWSIGLAVSGNEIGLPLEEVEKLDEAEFERKRQAACARMCETGAHYVVDTIADVMPCLDDIQDRLDHGEKP